MSASPDVIAYFERLKNFCERVDNPDEPWPVPPNNEVAIDVSATIANTLAMLIEFHISGQLEPISVEARLIAAQMIHDQTSGEADA